MYFKTLINASREKVWEVLWNEDTYPKWTVVFCEGSYAVSDWKQGSKIQFLSPGNNGMTSIITGKIPNEFMSFQHMGTIRNGVEDFDSEETKKWAGAMENYYLKTVDEQTELTIEIDVTDEFRNFFETTFPKATDIIKQLSEK